MGPPIPEAALNTLEWTLASGGALAALLVLRIILLCRIRYRIGRGELRIRLFGVTLRRIRYDDIERVSKPRRRHGRLQYENWTNALHAEHRELVIHRHSGLRRKLLITPGNRYEFRKSLETAIAAAGGSTLRSGAAGDDDSEGDPDPAAAP